MCFHCDCCNPIGSSGFNSMMMASEQATIDLYQKFLQLLSAIPQNPTDVVLWNRATNAGLQWIVSRIKSDLEPLGPHSGYGHLLCEKGLRPGRLAHQASSTTDHNIHPNHMIEIRSFLLQLISFRPKGLLQEWRERYENCLYNCLDCAIGHDACIANLRSKWLCIKNANSNPQQSDIFIDSLYKSLAAICDVAIERTNQPASDAQGTHPELDASQILPGLLTLILSRPEILTSPSIWPRISQAMASPRLSAPLQTLPPVQTLPGFILLTMSDNMACAKFARNQLAYFAAQNTTYTGVSGPSEAMLIVMSEISKIVNRDHLNSSSTESRLLLDLVIHPTRANAWLALASIIPSIPSAMLVSSPTSSILPAPFLGLPTLVLAHIDDPGDHFRTVHSCWGTLLSRLGRCFWSGLRVPPDTSSTSGPTTASSPLHALQRVLTHGTFSASLSSTDSIAQCIHWLIPFIRSVLDSDDLCTDTFNQLKRSLADDFQQAHFDWPVHTGAANLALSIWEKLSPEQSSPRTSTLLSPKAPSLLLHNITPHHSPSNETVPQTCLRRFMHAFLPFFTDLAYMIRKVLPSHWTQIQLRSHLILEKIAKQEAESLATAVTKLSDARLMMSHSQWTSGAGRVLDVDIQFSKVLWTRLYQVSSDFSASNLFLTRAVSLLIRSLSRCAHLDHLTIESWLPEEKAASGPLERGITTLNDAVIAMRAPLVDALMDISDSTHGSALISLLMSEPEIVQAIVILIFSPNDGLHSSSLALVRQWSDCTSRLDCFRVLLSKGQNSAFEGLLSSLQSTDRHTDILPDAMRLARRFVRCMTDVMEIFCSCSDGLLRDPGFLKHMNSSNVVKFWNLMCSSVAHIFEKTPTWARFYATSEMADWMRDALIFTEQLVEQSQTFETVATDRLVPMPTSGYATGDISIRSQMVDSFMLPTESLLTWLRLTEPDLLDRSTRVLVKMLEKLAKFRRPLKPLIVEKLARYVDRDSKRQPASTNTIGVLLTEQQCVYLKNALASHPDLAERFGTAIEDDEDYGSDTFLEEFIAAEEKQKEAQKHSWSDVFPSLNSKDRHPQRTSIGVDSFKKPPAVKPKGTTTQSAQSNPSTLKLDFSRPQGKSSLGVKPAARRNYAGASDSLIGNLRKDFKASRSVIHKARPLITRPIQQPSGPSRQPTARVPQDLSSASSGSNPGQPSVRNSSVPQANLIAEEPEESEEDSEGDESQPKGLAALAKAHKGKTFKSRKLTEPRRTIKMYNEPALEKHRQMVQARQQRQHQLKLEKLRMQPDFTTLHRHILQWDYNHSGCCPPNSPVRFDHLPPAFQHFTHYLTCLEPLLMCECWQQICQAKEAVEAGEKAPIPCEVIGRTSVDDFVEIYTTIKHGLLPDRMFFTEADLVLVKAAEQGTGRSILAKVISLHRKPEWFELNLRMHFGCARQDVSGHLVPKTKWEVIHLCSLSTTHREWAALHSLPYLTLGDDILDARATPPVSISDAQLQKVMHCQRVNEPQGRAIISSLATPGFSLIQGPPGTGKTSTIVGLIGAFIASRPSVTNSAGGPPAITRKILLCAPSNAAVDEVAKRLKDGVRGAQGELIMPKLVRIGADSKVNMAVKDIFIDELVEAMSKESEPGKAAATVCGSAGLIQDIRQRIFELRELRDSKQLEAERLPVGSAQYQELQAEVTRIKRQIHEQSQKIDDARDQHAASKRFLDAATRKLRMQILQDADVICSTLSGSGHDYMSQLPFDFETVVIDEACQCVEPASLIPLRYNATQCILVGDPLQLPPTVLSQTASQAGYDQSLFVRMQRNAPNAVHLLSIQYRMHPTISTFPSKAFYGSRLLDGPDMAAKTTQPWHGSESLFPPFAFYHAIGAREERGRQHSLMNRAEAGLAVAIYWRLVNDYPDIDFAYRVGIITGYSAQVGELRRQFRAKFSPEVVSTIDINTVDGFQGQEKDIIILSCVRAAKEDGGVPGGGIGFLKDTRRMNVALTRAKSSLFIIGNRVALGQDPNWKALMDDATHRGALSEVTSQTFLSPTTISKRPIVVKAQAPTRSSDKPASHVPVGILLTPKQIAEQSQARGQMAKDKREAELRRSVRPVLPPLASSVLDVNRVDGPNEISMPQREEVGESVPSSSSDSTRFSSNVPYSPVDRRPSLPLAATSSLAPRPAATNSMPMTKPHASGAHAPPRPPKKPNLFIKNTKRPQPIQSGRGDHGDNAGGRGGDTRSVRQRMQDEIGLIRKPAR